MDDRGPEGRPLAVRIAGAVLAPVAVTLALVPLRAHVLNTNLALVAVLVVLGAALAAGRPAEDRAQRRHRDHCVAGADRSGVRRVGGVGPAPRGGERPGRLIEVSARELTDMLGLRGCRYVPAPVPADLPVFTHTAIVVPGTESDNAPEGAVALPVRAHGRELGHFVLTFARPTYGVSVPPDAKHAAVALADQLGMALLRFRRP